MVYQPAPWAPSGWTLQTEKTKPLKLPRGGREPGTWDVQNSLSISVNSDASLILTLTATRRGARKPVPRTVRSRLGKGLAQSPPAS